MHNITIINNHYGVPITINDGTKPAGNKVTGTITSQINAIDAMDFNIYPDNSAYNSLHPYHTRAESVNTDGDTEFYGRVLKVKKIMTQGGEIYKNVICEGFMGLLKDVSVPNGTYANMMTLVVHEIFDLYNALGRDKFILKANEAECGTRSYTSDGENAYDFLMNKILAVTGGEIVLEEIQGTGWTRTFIVSIKLTEEDVCEDNKIEIGDNLISFESDTDISDLCTRIIPLGSRLYTDEDNPERLDISSVNNGIKYLESNVEEYGVIERAVIFEDVEDAQELKTQGEEYLSAHCNPEDTYQIAAFDKHLLNKDVAKIKLRSRYYINAPVLGADGKIVKVTQKTLCIENPANDTFSVGIAETASGSVASAESSNTGLRGPRGATGPKGEKGDTGPQGPKGDTGAAGKMTLMASFTLKAGTPVAIGSVALSAYNMIVLELTDISGNIKCSTIAPIKGSNSIAYAHKPGSSNVWVSIGNLTGGTANVTSYGMSTSDKVYIYGM